MTITFWIRLLLAASIVASLGACNSRRQGLQIGDMAPVVTLTDFHGNPVTLPKDIRGKVVLVRFWAMDCSHCNKETVLALETLYQKYKDKGFLTVAIHESRPVEADERFRKFDHVTYPMLVDEYGKVARQFGVIGLPTTLVLDEKGIVREKITGEASIDTFEKLLTTVLYKGGFYDGTH